MRTVPALVFRVFAASTISATSARKCRSLKRAATYDIEYLPEMFVAPELAEHSTSRVKRLRQKGSIFARRTVLTDEEPKEELE
jgi:hypothetical protein